MPFAILQRWAGVRAGVHLKALVLSLLDLQPPSTLAVRHCFTYVLISLSVAAGLPTRVPGLPRAAVC